MVAYAGLQDFNGNPSFILGNLWFVTESLNGYSDIAVALPLRS